CVGAPAGRGGEFGAESTAPPAGRGGPGGFGGGACARPPPGPPPHPGPVPILLGPAQQAVEDALLTAVGSQPLNPAVHSAGVSAAARRFAALPASARHALLATH